MFIQSNSFNAVLNYFREGLKNQFSDREIRKISREIICSRMGWSEMEFMLNSHATFSESDLLFFRSKRKALQNNEPFQYVIGEVYFYNLPLKIDRRALIPRPETEELVHLILEQNKSKKRTVLDLGTGSGCIPLALQKARPEWKVFGVDVDQEALSLAIENNQKNELDVQFSQLNILNENAHNMFLKQLDIIVSNPPYIPLNEKDKMAPHVVEHEPAKALFVQDRDPLLFYKHILKFAKLNLSPKGLLYLEIHEDLGSEVKALLVQAEMKNVIIHKDLQGKDRMVTAAMN